MCLTIQVKYYNSEGFEVRRFEDAILKYQVMQTLKRRLCKQLTGETLSWIFFLLRHVNGRPMLPWPSWTKPRTWSLGWGCWPDRCFVHIMLQWTSFKYSNHHSYKIGSLVLIDLEHNFCCSCSVVVLIGWWLCPLWNLHYPALHSTQLVWYIL